MPSPAIGILEWFRPGEQERVERVPCFVYTPPSLGLAPKTCSPPRDPKSYADFLDAMVSRFGSGFEWVELWNEPNNRREWDYTLDPDWMIFSKMVGGAAYWMKRLGKKIVPDFHSPYGCSKGAADQYGIDYARTYSFLGGGPGRTLSLLQLLDLMRGLYGEVPPLRYEGWRTGDQKYYVSDTSRFQAAAEWMPRMGVAEGVEKLYRWLCRNRERIQEAPRASGSRAWAVAGENPSR